jgi:hypothetical protein
VDRGGERTRRQLIADAERHGYAVSERLIVDWTARGLLGAPRRRGTGRGSAPAVFSENQARLFLEVLRQRENTKQAATLANVPVWFWIHYRNDYVTTDQARRALRTWAAFNLKGSASRVAVSVRELLSHGDNRRVTPAARQQLSKVLGGIVSGAPVDLTKVREQLVQALSGLYPPTSLSLPMVEAQADVIEWALLGAIPFAAGTDETEWSNADLARSRAFHAQSLADYKADNPREQPPPSEEVQTAALEFVKVLGFERRGRLLAESPGAES